MGFEGEFVPVDEEVLKREKAKARELRQSQWWKNLRGQGVCYYCKKKVHPSELTLDHKIPLSRGGKSVKGNLVAACKECNNKKKYLLPVEWEDFVQGKLND
ncbi:MAG: HNH endonuclease [Candidatus Lambdaproteobacteria bacterium RIFOXYD1_FULL_56_27]|uniref:HNH endonuclease n=1 Tax=Candidatus Lambdaproteobacteria bacterium RIFOXYD2_FULL_56_26 TaxID=1817773 RepID=A0A1F6H2S5_9PROT|nr:MAG: HNH endonuclease [Candidatus Lambdaproteobacteria bacterium RIFOXYC1_FULL_56_13]OGH04665.1 MAG: HNH endonuclease [Candidatus Lambdaproteobacteria bacterium RIFOXYD2_FULL_56_26]OGH09129.1 MAG: HNH endonuclease [Candidatus Lambdaproteobacteria bacterium RIFOXYD1_FULL_56_27]